MASAYLVTLDVTKSGYTLRAGANAAVVFAETTAQAIDMAKAALGSNLADDAAWAAATVTAVAAEAELEGWTFTINLTDNLTPFTLISATYVAADAAVIDTVGAGLAAALVAAGVAGAAYNAGTNVLTIVETTDVKGDWLISAYAYPPSNFENQNVSVQGFYGAITAAGAQGIARTSTLVAALPKLYGAFKQI